MKEIKHFVRNYINIPRCEYHEPLPEHRSRKIRIAVIDSGVSKTDIVIKRARDTNKIRGCLNFSPGLKSSDWGDTVGHGTKVARLLMEVAPEAEVYIAKVTGQENDYVPGDQLYCIANVSNTLPIKYRRDNAYKEGNRPSTGQFRNGRWTSLTYHWPSKVNTRTSRRPFERPWTRQM